MTPPMADPTRASAWPQAQADEPPQAHLGRDRVKEQREDAGFSVWVGKQ